MKTPILKAVAMPARIFWAPMMPAVVNFAVQMALAIVCMGVTGGHFNPEFFMWTIVMVHVGLIIWGAQEPHLGTILPAWGKARKFWDKEEKLKAGLLGPKSETEGVQIEGRQIRVVRLKGNVTFAADWRKWLMAMARYPVGVQIWSANQDEMKIILSADSTDPYRLKEALRDTLSLLGEFQPEELSVSDSSRIWEDILVQNVKCLKTNGTFVAQNSQKYMACLSVNRWGDFMDSNMVADLLALDGDVRIQHQMKVWPSVKANAYLMQERKMAFLTTFSQNVYNQYTTALQAIDSLSEFPQVAVNYAMTVWISARTMAELEGILVQAVSLFKQYGVQVVREKGLAKTSYITQFPGVVRATRRFVMLSDNVVSGLVVPSAGGTYSGARF